MGYNYYERQYQKALVVIYDMCNGEYLDYARVLYDNRLMNKQELIEELEVGCGLTDQEIGDILHEVLW